MLFSAIYWAAFVLGGIYLMLSAVLGHHDHPAQRFILGALLTVLFSILFWKTIDLRF